jgi:hypothetical protein
MNIKHNLRVFGGIIPFLLILMTCINSAALAAPPETMQVWRAQIQFQTANISDAGSDDSVRVRLNATNSTWLDYGRDDFERNTNYTYDLKLNGINRLSDIHYLYISKTGSDGWAIKSFSLLINGRTIYTQTFPGNGRWLDTDSGESPNYFVGFSTLRGDDAWVNYVPPFPPLILPRAELESRVEGIVGDYIHGNRLEWGHLHGRAVEATRKNANTVHFDLDLKADISYLPDPEVDVDFDVEVTCSNGTIAMKVKNVVVDVDSSPILQVLSLGLVNFLDAELSSRINDAVRNIKIGQNVPLGFCPGINVDSLVNLRFTPPIIVTMPALAKAQAQSPLLSDAVKEEDQPAGALEDNTKLLAVKIETGEARANEEMPYAINVKSNQTEGSQVDVSIELPAQVHLSSAAIEAVDASGNRTVIGAQAVPEAGKTVLRFRDYLNAGAAKTYTAKMRFVAQGESQIVARVTPLTSMETANDAAAVDAVTYLQNEGEATRAKATITRSSAQPKAEGKKE